VRVILPTLTDDANVGGVAGAGLDRDRVGVEQDVPVPGAEVGARRELDDVSAAGDVEKMTDLTVGGK